MAIQVLAKYLEYYFPSMQLSELHSFTVLEKSITDTFKNLAVKHPLKDLTLEGKEVTKEFCSKIPFSRIFSSEIKEANPFLKSRLA